jgi:hypothetical protein
MVTHLLDDSLGLLSNEHRRRTIQLLRSEDGVTTLEELLDEFVERGSDGDGTADRDRLHRQLVHCHLPKLDAHEVLEYDHENGTVRYRPNDRVETLLDSLPTEQAPASSH